MESPHFDDHYAYPGLPFQAEKRVEKYPVLRKLSNSVQRERKGQVVLLYIQGISEQITRTLNRHNIDAMIFKKPKDFFVDFGVFVGKILQIIAEKRSLQNKINNVRKGQKR